MPLILTFWKENKSFLIFIFFMFVFRSSFADWNTVPTGSMKPTIVEGDRIFVNKMAYDMRVPFSHISMYKIDDPLHGDIVVFDSAYSDKRLVKRVIGVSGDMIELKENTLYINGLALAYQNLSDDGFIEDRFEDLMGVHHEIRIHAEGSRLSSFPPVSVPPEHYLVLGDNRDNSADSRIIGFVPRDEIVGKATSVVLSLNYENYYLPRTERFFQSL